MRLTVFGSPGNLDVMSNSLNLWFVILGLCTTAQTHAQERGDCKQLVESVRIPVDTNVVSSENVLEARVYYKIVARGTFEKEDIGFGDGQYTFNKKQDLIVTRCQNNPVGLPFGIALDVDGKGSALENWGKFNLKHVYSIEVAGRERKASFHYQDCRPIGNKGSLMVDIYKCDRREKIK